MNYFGCNASVRGISMLKLIMLFESLLGCECDYRKGEFFYCLCVCDTFCGICDIFCGICDMLSVFSGVLEAVNCKDEK